MDILATDLYLVPMVLRYLMMWVISTCSMEATFADVRKSKETMEYLFVIVDSVSGQAFLTSR